jgi:hypothetical protein
MEEILRDPVWQFIATFFVGVTAIIVSIILYLKQRQRKALSYEIVSSIPLLSMEEEVKERLQILFNNKPVQKVYLVIVRIVNSGNVPITSADYEIPVSFCFHEDTKVLTAEISETNPENLRASLVIENTKIILTPILLNSGDSITIKMLVSQFDGQISVDGRIIGVKRIQNLVEHRIKLYSFILFFTLFFLIVGASLSIILYLQAIFSEPRLVSSTKLTLTQKIFLGFVFIITSLFLILMMKETIKETIIYMKEKFKK